MYHPHKGLPSFSSKSARSRLRAGILDEPALALLRRCCAAEGSVAMAWIASHFCEVCR